jgi:hypothetical protein
MRPTATIHVITCALSRPTSNRATNSRGLANARNRYADCSSSNATLSTTSTTTFYLSQKISKNPPCKPHKPHGRISPIRSFHKAHFRKQNHPEKPTATVAGKDSSILRYLPETILKQNVPWICALSPHSTLESVNPPAIDRIS